MTRWPHRPLRCRGEKAQAIKGGSAPNSKSLIVVRSVLFFCFLFSVFVRFHDYFSLLPLCHTVGALCRRDRHTVTVRMATDSSAAAASEPVGYVTGTCNCGKAQYKAAMPPKMVAHCHCQDCRYVFHCALRRVHSALPPPQRRPNPPECRKSRRLRLTFLSFRLFSFLGWAWWDGGDVT